MALNNYIGYCITRNSYVLRRYCQVGSLQHQSHASSSITKRSPQPFWRVAVLITRAETTLYCTFRVGGAKKMACASMVRLLSYQDQSLGPIDRFIWVHLLVLLFHSYFHSLLSSQYDCTRNVRLAVLEQGTLSERVLLIV
jgi:hypothetical protein